MTCTDVPPAVLVCDKSAIISWSPVNPFSDHLPLAWPAASPAKLNVSMEVPPLRRRVLRVKLSSLGFMSFLLSWLGPSGLSVSYANIGDD